MHDGRVAVVVVVVQVVEVMIDDIFVVAVSEQAWV
jgi:hypothetical protein